MIAQFVLLALLAPWTVSLSLSEAEFCPVLEAVINDIDHDFENIRGEEDEDAFFETYKLKLLLPGADGGEVSRTFGYFCSFSFGSTKNVKEAEKWLDEISSKIRECLDATWEKAEPGEHTYKEYRLEKITDELFQWSNVVEATIIEAKEEYFLSVTVAKKN